MEEKIITKIISESGVDAYAELKQSDIVYDPTFRDICKSNVCGQYGKCWMCPPDAGPIDELISKAKKYSQAIIYQTVTQLEDSFDVEGMAEGKKTFSKCSRFIAKKLKESEIKNYYQLGVGGCGICERCAKIDDAPCRFPDLAVPALETSGIFVSETAKNAGLKYINGKDTVTYFGMVLF